MASSSDETDKKRCNVDVLIEAGPRIESGIQLVCSVLIDARGFYSRIYGT